MPDIIKVTKWDNTHLWLDCEKGIAQEFDDAYSFEVPGAKFMPAVKNKMWDGRIRLFDRNFYRLPTGLYSHLEDLVTKRRYQLDLIEGEHGYPNEKNRIDLGELYGFIKALNLHSKGEKIEIRDYQFAAVLEAIVNKRRILLSPTGSGKSLIIYVIMRWYLDNFDDQVLIVVPTTSLVEQMYSDFADYSSHDDSFDVNDMCHKIMAGKEKEIFSEKVAISTWQSIFRLPQTWFERYGCVFGDEVHGFKAKSLTSIMNKSMNASYRFGTTGTLDDSQVHELVLRGLFGSVFKTTTTKRLQDKGALAPLKIQILALKHPKDIRKTFTSTTYQQEITYIVKNDRRNRFVRDLTLSCDGNTLVLFQLVEKHGKPLFQMIEDKAENGRKVFFISGETDTKAREFVRKIVETEKNAIIVASMGVFSTGINIKNLHNIVFPSPAKSKIRVLQSIGRGLRKSDDGRTTVLYDIIDDITWKSRKNYAFRHGEERLRLYKKEKFEYNVYKLTLGDDT